MIVRGGRGGIGTRLSGREGSAAFGLVQRATLCRVLYSNVFKLHVFCQNNGEMP